MHLSRQFHVKLVSPAIHVKYFIWISRETSFTFNLRDSFTWNAHETNLTWNSCEIHMKQISREIHVQFTWIFHEKFTWNSFNVKFTRGDFACVIWWKVRVTVTIMCRLWFYNTVKLKLLTAFFIFCILDNSWNGNNCWKYFQTWIWFVHSLKYLKIILINCFTWYNLFVIFFFTTCT